MKIKLLVLFLWSLALIVLATIVTVWLIYPAEIVWLSLSKITYLSDKTILYNFNHLMIYLTNPFVHKLSMPNFRSSASGLFHFRSVKYLFHLVECVVALGSYPILKWLKKDRTIFFGYKKVYLLILLLPIFGVLMSAVIGFEQFFVLFHQILFPNDTTWLFDPAKDPVILILPQSLFLQAFSLFAIYYYGLFLTCYRLFFMKKGNNFHENMVK